MLTGVLIFLEKRNMVQPGGMRVSGVPESSRDAPLVSSTAWGWGLAAHAVKGDWPGALLCQAWEVLIWSVMSQCGRRDTWWHSVSPRALFLQLLPASLYGLHPPGFVLALSFLPSCKQLLTDDVKQF